MLGGLPFLLGAGTDLDSLLRAGTATAGILAVTAGAYAGFMGVKTTRATRTLEERKQDYVEKTGQIANLMERADGCEARERLLRDEVTVLRQRDDAREAEVRVLRDRDGEREAELRDLRRLVDRRWPGEGPEAGL